MIKCPKTRKGKRCDWCSHWTGRGVGLIVCGSRISICRYKFSLKSLLSSVRRNIK